MEKFILPDGFLPVFGYEDYYAISKNGEIIRTKQCRGAQVGVYRKPSIHKTRGYLIVSLCAKGKQKTHDVHVLVAKTFIGNYEKGMQVCHNNGVKTDCKLDNLRVDTMSANQMDRALHGSSNRGERSGHNKYSQEVILQIRKEFCNNVKPKELAKKYGIPYSYIIQIKNKTKWSWL